MRVQHASHSTSFPIFCSSFISPDKFLIGGGGGASKTGVKNTIRLYHAKSVKEVEILDELVFGKDEDAPMSMAYNSTTHEFVCGINSSPEKHQSGDNENCRVFQISSDKISYSRCSKHFSSSAQDDYIRVAAFSTDLKLLALASTNDHSDVVKYPELNPLSMNITSRCGQLYDISFGPSLMVTAGTSGMAVYNVPSSSAGFVQLAKVIEKPYLPGSSGSDGVISYRAARFHPNHPETLFTVLNTSPSRAARSKSERKTYIARYDIKTWKVSKAKRVWEKGNITCFDISPNGRFLAFGTSGCVVGVLDAVSLAPIFTILRIHELPPTTLRFNPEGTVLLSGSADNTFRLIEVPKSGAGPAWITIILIILTVVMLVLGLSIETFRRT